MSNDKFELSRRKALGALGAIGAASAGAGLGTSAYFSDTESFEGNQLTAGELDLKVDWEEHYWNDFDVETAVQHVSSADDVGDSQVGLPDPEDPMIAVDDLDAFMDATAIEAFPDGDDDGVQDDLEGIDACSDFADMDSGLDPTGMRTANDDTQLDDGSGAPLVNLHDVKPGDFGELTLSFHLCDNPGYVWLQGEQVSAAENGHTEPESEVDDDQDVELLDEIQTLLWYDEDGDNVFEPGGEAGEADVVLVLDRSGSMSGQRISDEKSAAKSLIDALGSGAQVGVVSFADDVTLDQGLTSDKSAAKSAVDGLSASGSTNIEGGVDAGHEELTGNDISGDITASGDHRSSADPIMVVLSDGRPNENGDGTDETGADYDGDGDSDFNFVDPNDNATAAKNAGIEMYTVGLGITSGSETAGLLETMASNPKDSHFFLGASQELINIFGQIAKQIAGEEAFFRGSLRDLLMAVSDGDGIPLDGDRATEFDELNDPDDAETRDHYVDSTNNFLGLAWWVPRSVGNAIQGDSVGFDLGFYTEQSRHNDGSGPTTPTSTST